MQNKRISYSVSFFLLFSCVLWLGPFFSSPILVQDEVDFKGPKTSAGEITIITPENKTYIEPDSGYYPATFGFENDLSSTPPQSLISTAGSGTNIEVIDQLDGHNKVTRLYDGSSGTNNYANLSHTFSPQPIGVVEFWFRRSGVEEIIFIELWNETFHCLSIYSQDIGSGLAFEYYNGTDYVTIISHNSDQWYHHRLDFNCTSGTFDWYIDGVLRGDDLLLRDTTPYFIRFTVRTRGLGLTGYNAYIDGLGTSWDNDYNVGDNFNEGLLLSYENSTTLDWKGYSLDGQTNKTILGNTTIPMPDDGHHTIQVFGNDSSGAMFESDMRHFTTNLISPDITIISPTSNQLYGITSPDFGLSISASDLNETWYSLDGGTTNLPFSGLSGTIDQVEWDKIGNGTVTITFYANDTINNIGQAEVTIRKDILAPLITVNSPVENQVFGENAPSFDLTILEQEIDATWYTLDYGSVNVSFSGSTGVIDQTEWGKKGGGTVPIRFYANDSLGNVGFSEVIVVKDLITPIVSINLPDLNELFGSTPPNFDITVTESNPDSMWYTLDSGATNVTFSSLTGTIDQTEWDKRGNGTVTIIFYARDEGRNEGFAEIIVRKDINIPLITINAPITNDIFGFQPPQYDISVVEPNIDTMWYTLDYGATNITFGSLTGTIDQTEWDKFSDGSVIIRFYVRDEGRNEGFAETIVKKDVNIPLITINAPNTNDIFGFQPPQYDISVVEPNIDTMWYTLDSGATNITFGSLTGTIDQTEWGKKGGGAVPIRFYANDSLGNVGFSEVIVVKDLITPIVSINLPDLNELFGSTPPNFDITVTESNPDSMWYTLDSGATNVTFSSLTGTIDQTEWSNQGNGTVTIRFYAEDEAGNVGFEEIIIRKDVNIPLITINSPTTNDIFGIRAPQYDVSVVESNIDSMWYTLDNGITTTSFTEFTGTIDQTEWEKFGDGIVIIRFYVRDKSDNEAFAEVSINKDLIAPVITINEPEFGEVFVDIAPLYSITIDETSLDSYWYSLDGGQTNHTISELTGAIDQAAWDSLSDGHLTLIFYAEDEAGNVGQSSMTITKRTTPVPIPPGISGYDLYLLIGALSVISAFIIGKRLKS